MVAEDLTLGSKPGGSRSVSMVADGERHECGGMYREVIENGRLVISWRWRGGPPDEESLVTVDFVETDSGAEIELTHERLPGREREPEHVQGWTGILENLESAP